MPYYFMTLILLVVSIFLAIITLAVNGKGKVAFGVGAVAAAISAAISFTTMSIPKPEIYTTNGNSIKENEVYFSTEWPLTVKYTLVPYDDPMKNGEEFKENIPIIRSMAVSAKATLFGIKWSELESKDIIIGSNNEIAIIDPNSPGSSIMKISAYFVGGRYFPGDELSQEDIKVEGETLAGDKVVIEDYSFSPNVMVEGKNEIQITYKNLEYIIHHTVLPPEMVDIGVEYISDDLRVGDTLTTDMFKVTGIYENGNHAELTEFTIEPEKFEENGEKEVTITVDDMKKTVPVTVYEREYAFTLVSEVHTPNGSYDPNVSVTNWKENEDYSIDGITFPVGSKVEFNNWMSGLMGNGSDFAENVTCKLFFAVNQNVIGKRDRSERFFDGRFVVCRDTNGSSTTMAIKILADGNEVYQSDTITSSSTGIPAFHVDADGVQQIVIQIEARVTGRPFVLGIAYD